MYFMKDGVTSLTEESLGDNHKGLKKVFNMRDKPDPKPTTNVSSPPNTAISRLKQEKKKIASDLKVFGTTQTIHPYSDLYRPKTQINNMRENVVVSCQPVEHLLHGNSSQLLRSSGDGQEALGNTSKFAQRKSVDIRKGAKHVMVNTTDN